MSKRNFLILLNGILILILCGILWKTRESQRYMRNASTLLRWERIKQNDKAERSKGWLSHIAKDTLVVPENLRSEIDPDSIHSFHQFYQLLKTHRPELTLPSLPDARKFPDILDSLVIENASMSIVSGLQRHARLNKLAKKKYSIRPLVHAIHRNDSVMQVAVSPFYVDEAPQLSFFIHDRPVSGPPIQWNGSLTALKAVYIHPFTNETQIFKGMDQPNQTEWLSATY